MISSKGRYALRVMIDLARQNSDGYVPLKEIAERQNISKKYLEIIAKELVNAKLLKGVSGKGGGYKLSRKPEEYPDTLPMWSELNQLIHDFLYSKKLSDLL